MATLEDFKNKIAKIRGETKDRLNNLENLRNFSGAISDREKSLIKEQETFVGGGKADTKDKRTKFKKLADSIFYD